MTATAIRRENQRADRIMAAATKRGTLLRFPKLPCHCLACYSRAVDDVDRFMDALERGAKRSDLWRCRHPKQRRVVAA